MASHRSILHALTAVGRGERLSIQLVLGPRQPQNSARRTQAGRSTGGVQGVARRADRRIDPDARQALIHKLGQHAFAADVRIGVERATAERRTRLLLGSLPLSAPLKSPGVRLKLKAEKPVGSMRRAHRGRCSRRRSA